MCLKKLHLFVCLKLHFSKESKGFKPKQEISNIPSSANAEEYIFCCMVQNIRNNWVIAANQAQTDERRRPSQSRSESRSSLAVPANPKEHAPCPCFVQHVQKRHSAHIIHILYNGVPAEEWLQRCARQHNIHCSS